MPPPASAAPMEELIEEILLRFPPHDPALLVRAALVCKQWCCLIFGAGFRRRFRELHRTPPLLGFLYTSYDYSSTYKARFVRTAASCPPIAYGSHCLVLDARHGRVLLRAGREKALLIWDPITDEQRELSVPKLSESLVSWNAAVLCADHGSCNHLNCRSFLVVFMCLDASEMTISTYLCDAATWSDPICTPRQPLDEMQLFTPCALVGNALYFQFHRGKSVILKFELESHEISVIDLPHIHRECDVLITRVDGGLGFVTLHESKLYMWSRKDGLGVDAGWTRNRVIDLEMLLRSNAIFTFPNVIGR